MLTYHKLLKVSDEQWDIIVASLHPEMQEASKNGTSEIILYSSWRGETGEPIRVVRL